MKDEQLKQEEPSEMSEMSDDHLFDAIREQVNMARHGSGHQPERTRALAEEAKRRGWNFRTPKP